MGKIGLTATKVGAQETKNIISGVNVQTSPVHVGNSEYEELIPEESVNVTVGVFFDGTLNNRENTTARLEYEKKQNNQSYNKKQADAYDTWYTFRKSGSYDNDFSNVSRMEPAYEKIEEEQNHQLSIYIEGIGTEDQESDSTWGSAMGKGATGVKGKVKKGCEKIAELIAKLNIKKINRLQIDAYGFSRGAAAARNFIFEINQKQNDQKEILMDGIYDHFGDVYIEDGGVLGEKLAENGITARLKIEARFVGLYDTVASFGVYHQNDVNQLNLKSIRKANYTFQLAANDEHRSNFMLSTIGNARGTEKYLPGVHSDIGGGYTDKTDEEISLDYTLGSLSNMDNERQVMIDQGWYLSNEIWVDRFWGSLKAKREQISNKYSLIPLHIMVEFALHKNVLFMISKITRKYPIKNEANKGVKLTEVKARLDAYIKGEKGRLSLDNTEDKNMLMALRNKYFHFSAHYNGRIAGLIPPMKPNRERGLRTRETLDG